jgi:hypothetical protein
MSSRLPDDEVVERVRWLWENGIARRTFHFDDELRKAGATMQDVEALIRGSFRVQSASWKKEHKNWNYALVGCDEEGDEISLVVSLNRIDSILLLITAF